jgi:hypothetical protein
MAIVGTITVTTAGTAVQSPKSGSVKAVLFKASSSNTGAIYVGDSSVSSSNGVELQPGAAIQMAFEGYERLEDWYADADDNNDRVDFIGDNS